ncbi:glutamyl aminopeptidase-like [Argonauta hians]
MKENMDMSAGGELNGIQPSQTGNVTNPPSDGLVKTHNTIVSVQPERGNRANAGCYVTKVQISLFLFLILLATIFIALIAAFIGRNTHCDCQVSQQNDSINRDSKNITEERKTGVRGKNEFNASVKPVRGRGNKLWDRQRLPRSLIPSHYSLELKVNMFFFIFSGSVNITIRVHQPTHYVIFHSKDLDIYNKSISVHLTGNISNTVPIGRQFYVKENKYQVLILSQTLKKGKDYIISIGSFSGKIAPDMRGLYKGSYVTKRGEIRHLASSQLQVADARKVFPCFDEPDLKAQFTVSIVYPPGYVALSNMPIVNQTKISDEWMRNQYSTSPVMSSYLLAFVVADFDYREKILKNNYTLRMWAQREKINQTNYAMKFAERCYSFFTDYFNISDVLTKSDHVAVPEFNAGAMENWGLVIYRETALLYDPDVSSSSNKYMVTLIIAHEIAHTWFGNMATMRWWDDLWLNEGFASILMYFGMNYVHPEWDVFSILVVDEILPVMVLDALLTSHAVSSRIENTEQIIQYFDNISYNKGMAILRMLKGFLGWEDFRRSLQNFILKYKFANAHVDELWQVFTETVNGRYQIKAIMDTWTLQMGYPVVNIKADGSEHYLIEQKRFLLQPGDKFNVSESPYKYMWHIPFVYSFKSSPSKNELHWLTNSSDRIKVTGNGWILGNVDHIGFYRVNYEVNMWKQLTEQLHKDHTVFLPSSRAGLIGDALNLARAGQLDYHVALNITTYLKKENHFVPWKAFLDALDFVNAMLDTSDSYGNFQKYLTDMVFPVFKKIKLNGKGTLPQRYMRRLILNAACNLGIPEAVEYAKKMFRDWMKTGRKLPSDLATIIYTVGIRHGDAKEWDFMWAQTRHTNVASEKHMLLEALAQTEVPWLIWRYINWVFESSKVRQQDVRLIFNYFTKNSLGRIITLQFILSKWQQILSSSFMESFSSKDIISSVTTYVNNKYQMEQLEQLFKKNPAIDAKITINNALEIMRSNVNWMTDNKQTIDNWLREYVKHLSKT